MSKKIGLALGGGGARGLSHIGILKVFERERIPVTQITGCSIGAIIGGLYAYLGSADQVQQYIHKMISDPVFKDLNIQLFATMNREDRHFFFDGHLHNLKMYFSLLKTIRTPSVFSAEAVEKMFELYPDVDLKSLKIKFATIATDLISGREIVINEGSLRKAVRASSSIPGFFPPVKMDHMLLVDGAATDSIPVQIVRGQGAQYVIAVDVSKCINDIGSLETGLQVIYRAEDIVSHHLTQERIAGVDYLIRPEVGHYSWAAIDQMDEIIAAGEQAAQKAIPEIKRILGCKE